MGQTSISQSVTKHAPHAEDPWPTLPCLGLDSTPQTEGESVASPVVPIPKRCIEGSRCVPKPHSCHGWSELFTQTLVLSSLSLAQSRCSKTVHSRSEWKNSWIFPAWPLDQFCQQREGPRADRGRVTAVPVCQPETPLVPHSSPCSCWASVAFGPCAQPARLEQVVCRVESSLSCSWFPVLLILLPSGRTWL